MDKARKAGRVAFNIYMGVGVVAMGLLAFMIIFSIVCRYFFHLNWKQLSEFSVVLFAFTTFWGMGVNVLKGEHVTIEILYDKFRPSVKRWMSVVNYIVVLIVNVLFTVYGISYVSMAGVQISQGMGIPMKYMYGIMPVCGILCAICTTLKIVEFIVADTSYFETADKTVAKKGTASEGE